MPTAKVHCLECDTVLKLPGLPPGKTVQCPKCQTRFEVPDEEANGNDPDESDAVTAGSPIKMTKRESADDGEADPELEGSASARKKARQPKKEAVGPWLMACGGCSVLTLVVMIGAAIAAYVTTQPGGAFRWLVADDGEFRGNPVIKDQPPPKLEKQIPGGAGVPGGDAPKKPGGDAPKGPAGKNADFKAMVDRLAGRWIGKTPEGDTVTYEYLANGTFRLRVEGGGQPVNVDGSWVVVGVGLDSVNIQRRGTAGAGDWFTPDDRVTISFPDPGQLQHPYANGKRSVTCQREGAKK